MAGESRRRRLRALLHLAGVPAEDLDALDPAFVHPSAAAESGGGSNERLEFLGDAVLGLVAASHLYAAYPGDEEGALTKRKAAVVSDAALARSARRLGFSDLVLLGTGERAAGGGERASVLADALEAFIAALYLRYGLERAREFVEREHIAYVDHAATEADAKTALQEYAQEHLGCAPAYYDEGTGPPHARVFTSHASVKGEALGCGSGPSKKAAQQVAAAQALEALRARNR